jgi:predicted site-specific integrase-resolvase
MSEPVYVPLRVVARQTGIDRQALQRWLRTGMITGRQDDTGHWFVDPESISEDLKETYRRRRAAVVGNITGDRAPADQAADVAELRRMVTELMASNREKDRLIAKLLEDRKTS